MNTTSPPVIVSVAAPVQSDARSETGRVVALDLTKGVLVLCMVIYHALNYTTEYYLAFRYFAFLPPSFIVITGFLLASIYPVKHSLSDWRLHQRLVLRGARLLLLFTALNMVIQFIGAWNLHGTFLGLSVWWEYWFETYISGEGRTAAFEVLLPIGYLLLLAPILLVLNRSHWLVVPILTGVIMGVLAWEARHGGFWFNAQLMSAGLIGVSLGRSSFAALDQCARFWGALLLAYAIYFTVGRLLGLGYLLQMAGAVVGLALIYSVCTRINPETFAGQRLERLGCYSLVAYIGQIGILQVLVRLMGRPEPFSPHFFLLLFSTFVLTDAGVEFVHWMRSRSTVVGAAYKAVFA